MQIFFFVGRSKSPASPQFGIGTSTWSAQGRIGRFPVRRPNSSLGGWSQAADAIAYGHPFAQMGITFRSVIGIAYKTPIRNRHSNMLIAPYCRIRKDLISGSKNLHFALQNCDSDGRSPCFKGFHDNVSLDHVNLGRGGHTESVSHGDRKLCSTRRENSSPGRRYGCTNIAYNQPFSSYSHPFRERTAHNFPHGYRNHLSEHNSKSAFRDGRQDSSFVKLRVKIEIPPWSVCTSTPIVLPLGFSRNNVSVDHVNPGRASLTESDSHGDRKLCSTRYEKSSPGSRYGCTNIADIVTPFGIAYVSTIQNRHSKTVDRTLVSQNSMSGPKFHRRACVLVHRLSYPLGKTQIFFSVAIGTTRESPIRNRHFDPAGTRSDLEISGPTPKFLSGRVVAGCRFDRIRTPIRSNEHNFSLGYQNHL
ncbi:hypothetical protein Taro_018141 [Colocasia esculenta]|uniref:Uncharacterized protein n=1 Tax=Colocasia esculenta TaxID=4460 RepID=A0A843V1J3_COLES|nr:hypothetical protein [Colocasia esculenta]